MASNKNTTLSIPKPGLSGRPQSQLDWNVRRKPAATLPHKYASLMPEWWMLLSSPDSGGFGPASNQAVIQ